ncbi:MAG: fumarylacetoacetate hydrolase family protein, partial [Dokdonella sp.]|uniref:fumarylacetoacetate hydrolase family protein n=1 Tax=Dokdonella sp. TaxID=2291710 RepID=UPI00326575CE
GHPRHASMSLAVNGEVRQQSDIAEMIFPVDAIIHELSRLWELKAGDLIFTGTPAGVAALQRGDRFRAQLGNFATLDGHIV